MRLSLGTRRSCMLTSYVGLMKLITYNAHNSKPRVYVHDPLFHS